MLDLSTRPISPNYSAYSQVSMISKDHYIFIFSTPISMSQGRLDFLLCSHAFVFCVSSVGSCHSPVSTYSSMLKWNISSSFRSSLILPTRILFLSSETSWHALSLDSYYWLHLYDQRWIFSLLLDQSLLNSESYFNPIGALLNIWSSVLPLMVH